MIVPEDHTNTSMEKSENVIRITPRKIVNEILDISVTKWKVEQWTRSDKQVDSHTALNDIRLI